MMSVPTSSSFSNRGDVIEHEDIRKLNISEILPFLKGDNGEVFSAFSAKWR